MAAGQRVSGCVPWRSLSRSRRGEDSHPASVVLLHYQRDNPADKRLQETNKLKSVSQPASLPASRDDGDVC